MPLLHTSLLYNIFCQESSAFSIFRLVFQKSLASCGKIIRNVSGLLKKFNGHLYNSKQIENKSKK